MQQSPVEKARLLAIKAHKGQVDKQGQAYIIHPAFVADQMTTDEEKQVAWLHDVVEDTETTLDDLKAEGFSDEVIAAVDAITRPEGLAYMAYIHLVARNPLARCVKIADLKHNLEKSKSFDIGNTTKYQQALGILQF